MNRHKTKPIVAVALLLIVTSGCRTTPRDMAGSSLADVEKRFGPPDLKAETKTPAAPTRAPRPILLKPGDPYLLVSYKNLRGRYWELRFVSPQMYSRIKGTSPGSAPWYLLETADWPKDLLF